jgi:hypothetical protein
MKHLTLHNLAFRLKQDVDCEVEYSTLNNVGKLNLVVTSSKFTGPQNLCLQLITILGDFIVVIDEQSYNEAINRVKLISEWTYNNNERINRTILDSSRSNIKCTFE